LNYLICERFFTAPLRVLSPTGLFIAIAAFRFEAVYGNPSHFLPVAVQDRDAARLGRPRLLCDLTRNHGTGFNCFLVIAAVDAGEIDQTVTVFHIKKVTHRKSSKCLPIEQCSSEDSVPERITARDLESRFGSVWSSGNA
jgi:hypothetical protein